MTMLAKRKSRCPKCYEAIEIGDPIEQKSDWEYWQHVTCQPKADDLAPRNPVCTACWLDHPEGRCDR